MTKPLEQYNSLLFVGAHPDDLVISSAGLINRNKSKSHTVTVTDGAALFDTLYPIIDADNKQYDTPEAIRTVKIKQDIAAMNHLGIHPSKYNNLYVSDQETYKNIDLIINSIENICSNYHIDAIITHEFPQGHPDHEVVNFCSHYVASLNNIDVFEYPMYSADSDGKTFFGGFISNTKFPTSSILLSDKEFQKKINAMKSYRSELSYLENLSKRESIRKTVRNIDEYFSPENRVDYIKWILKATPEAVRELLAEYVAVRGPFHESK